MTTTKLPPSPRGLPWLGTALDHRRDPLGHLRRAAREHGDVVQLRFGPYKSLLISHPADIERMLVTDNKSYSKDLFLRDLKRVVGNGLLTSEGDFWRRQRRLAQPAFHRDRIAAYAQVMVGAAEGLLSSWWPGQVRDIHEDMMRLTLEVVTGTLFVSKIARRAEDVGSALSAVMERYADLTKVVFPLLAALPPAANRRFERAGRDLDRLVREVIAEHRESDSDAGDLLSMLLAARDDDGHGMSDDQLRDEVLTIFLAGHETTALSLSITRLLLSQNPAVDALLEAELGEVLGGRSPTLADLPRLKYTERVLTESMRLYPPAWSMGREALVDTEIGGYHVPKGSQIAASQWVVHRDPRFYDAPDDFRPDRWAGDLARTLPRYAYFPFGGGPRLCIGNSFAMMESVLLLATLAQRFRPAVLPGPPMELVASVTLRPRHGIRAELEARLPRERARPGPAPRPPAAGDA